MIFLFTIIGGDVTVCSYGRYSDVPGRLITTGAVLTIHGGPAFTTKLSGLRLMTIGACLLTKTFGFGAGAVYGHNN